MNIVTKNPSEMISLAQLTPLNCKDALDSKVLQAQVSNYKNVIELTCTAVDSFLDGNFPDPLVGENACQIRAAMYCQIAQDQEVVVELKQLSATLKKISVAEVNISIKGKERSSLIEVLDKQQVNVLVPERLGDVVGLILYSHVLDVTKLSDLKIENREVSLKEVSEPKRLPQLTLNFAKELVKESRKALAERSIQYLHHSIELLPMSLRVNRMSHLLDTAVLKDSLGLQSFPCLPGMKILLESMKMHRTAIVLKDLIIGSDEMKKGTITLVCKPVHNPKKNKSRYGVVKDPSKLDPNQPAVMVKAAAFSDKSLQDLKRSLVKIGAETIILANSAAHTQYGGSNKNVEPAETKTRTDLTKFANENGLCAAEPTLFRIFHIYAGTLQQHLEEVTV